MPRRSTRERYSEAIEPGEVTEGSAAAAFEGCPGTSACDRRGDRGDVGCPGEDVRDGDAADVEDGCLTSYGDLGGERGNVGCPGDDAREDGLEGAEGCHGTYCTAN